MAKGKPNRGTNKDMRLKQNKKTKGRKKSK